MDHSIQIRFGLGDCDAQGSPSGSDDHPQAEDALLTSKIDGTKTHLTDRTGRRHNLEPLTTQLEAHPKGKSALLSLPVEIVLEDIIPRVKHRDLQSLSTACGAFRSALLPQLLRTVISVLPRFKSGSKVDALIIFIDHFRQFFSFAAAEHVEALKIMSTGDPTRYRMNYEQKRLFNWQQRTVEILWPHVPRLSVRSLTLSMVHLTNPELDGICSMQRLRNLALTSCRIDVEEPIYVDLHFRLQALEIMAVEFTHPEFLWTALVNPDLQHLGLALGGHAGVFDEMPPLTPLPHVGTAEVTLRGPYGFVDLLSVIPNVVKLHFPMTATSAYRQFSLPPNAFPHLKKLEIHGMAYIQSDLASHSLETLKLWSLDDALVVQLTHAWSDRPRAIAGLTSLDMWIERMELEHLATLMGMVARNCTSLNRLCIRSFYMEKEENVQDIVKAVTLPVSIRHLYVQDGFERRSRLILDDIKEITEELSIYENMEYFSIGDLSVAINYDLEVYGPLSNTRCRAEFIQTMQARLSLPHFRRRGKPDIG